MDDTIPEIAAVSGHRTLISYLDMLIQNLEGALYSLIKINKKR